MSTQTSLFLPHNAFVVGGAYAASLVGANGNTSTLAVRCTAAPTQASAGCGPDAPTTTITIAPTSFAFTTASKAVQDVVTITETCSLAPAVSTAVCNIIANSGLTEPFNVTAREYAANIHPVEITNFATRTTATNTSSPSATATSTFSSATATATPTTGNSLGTKTAANGKSGFALLVLCAICAVIGL